MNTLTNSKIILHTVLISTILFFFGCNKEQTEKQSDPNEQHGQHAEEQMESAIVHLDKHKVFHAGIRLEEVQKKSVAIPLTLPGKVALNERKLAMITSRLSGRIEKLFAFTNDNVTENQVVAELYSQEFLSMQLEFLQANERWKRTKEKTAEEQTTIKAIYESSKRKLLVVGVSEQDISELENTQTPKTFLEIHATISGIILENKIHQGEFVEMGKELFELANLSTLWVLADVYEKDLPFVKEGMKARVEASAIQESFDGVVNSIYNVIDEKTRTVKGRIEVVNDGKLKPEMFCTVQIQTKLGAETIKIPASALLGETEKHFVFVALNDTTFEKRDVKTGIETREFSEILDGIVVGEKIVVKGGFFLKSELAKETFGEDH
ncbi:MAG: efflux RND transporter periplasmic adaptor subunit [Bacteroidota bacterium]